MKILVQSDDYGFTRGIVDACCDAFENGFLRCTGLFANMPTAPYAAARMKEYPDICFGIDINVASGPCVADRSKLPHLVNQETGCFIQTTERMKDKNFTKKLFRPYDECVIEAKAQLERFVALTGRMPEYLCPHSTAGETEYTRALNDVAAEYGLPFRENILKQFHFESITEAAIKHHIPEGIASKTYANVKEAQMHVNIYSTEFQMLDEVEPTLKELDRLWEKGAEYVYMGGHCGFVDVDLFRLSRCNINRAFDHQMYTSKKIMQWFRDHNVELITYRDLPWQEQ